MLLFSEADIEKMAARHGQAATAGGEGEKAARRRPTPPKGFRYRDYV